MRLLAVAVMALFAVNLCAEPNYIGADKCAKMCHKSKAKGDQYGIWKGTRHSEAYAVLATPAALETAKKAGITGDPQKSPKCVKCHVAGFGLSAARFDSTYSLTEGVGCEACHGPGSDYSKLKIMKDKQLALKAGLIEPTERVCVKCHNTESPNYKPFVFAEAYKKIAHPTPKAAPETK